MSPKSLLAEVVMRILQQRKRPMRAPRLRGLATVFMARVLADSARARAGARIQSLSVKVGMQPYPKTIRTAHRAYLAACKAALGATHPLVA